MTANLDRQAITSDGFVVGVAHGMFATHRALTEDWAGRGGFIRGRVLGSVPAQLLDEVDLAELCRGGFVRRDVETLQREAEDRDAEPDEAEERDAAVDDTRAKLWPS